MDTGTTADVLKHVGEPGTHADLSFIVKTYPGFGFIGPILDQVSQQMPQVPQQIPQQIPQQMPQIPQQIPDMPTPMLQQERFYGPPVPEQPIQQMPPGMNRGGIMSLRHM